MLKVRDTYPVEARGALSSPHLKAFGSVGCQWFLIPHILGCCAPQGSSMACSYWVISTGYKALGSYSGRRDNCVTLLCSWAPCTEAEGGLPECLSEPGSTAPHSSRSCFSFLQMEFGSPLPTTDIRPSTADSSIVGTWSGTPDGMWFYPGEAGFVSGSTRHEASNGSKVITCASVTTFW